MYKVHHPQDDSELYYPDRKSTDTVSVVEVGAMSPWRDYKCNIIHGNIFLLQYVISGEGLFRDEPFKAPCFFVIAPNDLLSYSVNADSEHFEQYWLKLEGKYVTSFLSEAGIPTQTGVYPFSYAKQLCKVFSELTTDSSYTNTDDRYFMLQGFFSICALHRDSLKKNNASAGVSAYTRAALEYMHTHYNEPINEQTLAYHLHISVSYLHRLFRQDMGVTPNYYLNRYRIQYAKKLLTETSYSIAQIAEQLGFSSGDYFCRVCQKYLDCSPTQYRKAKKQVNENRIISNVNGTSKNKIDWIYKDETTGIMVREVDITVNSDRPPIRIGLASDAHFNYCNNLDFEENNPTLMSSFQHRKWLANGKNVAKTNNCLKYISNCNQIVMLGDILDYLSHGAIELAQKHIFEKYPDIIACVGNHDAVRKMQGKVEEVEPLEERRQIVQSIWPHNIDYYSRVIDNRIMIIQMDNSSRNCFVHAQIVSLKKDIALAREKDYAVLLCFHTPLSINNPAITSSFPIRRNDAGVINFNSKTLIGYHSQGASREGYEIITNNADIIKAVFCAHMHSDYYTEILAKTADGQDKIIPQYILTGIPYDQGHVMIVNIK